MANDLRSEQIDYSIRGILNVTLPLVLSALSANLMYVTDRIILGYYSLNAMTAAGIAMNILGLYSFFAVSIASTAEVFIGQYNGASKTQKLTEPVWQMVYFALFSFVLFVPLGFFTETLSFFPEYCKSEGVSYQSILTTFSAIPAINSAFSAFFIGRGKTKIITLVVFIGGILNIFLDYILIFGVDGVVPEMGARGAALATIFSTVVQTIILFLAFASKHNRTKYNAFQNMKFNKEIFFGCLKIGAPLAIGRIFELLAWYIVFVALSYTSQRLAMIQSICVSIYILFIFFGDGLNKSIATLSANLIGQKDLAGIKRLFKIFVWMVLICGILMIFPLVVFPKLVFYWLDTFPEDISYLYQDIAVIFKIMFLNITLETLGAVTWGILLSGGDTRYPIVANLICLWSFVVIPVLSLFFLNKLNSAEIVYILSTFWCISSLFFIYRRYKSLRWYNLIIK